MADNSEQQSQQAAVKRALATARAFVAAHGAPTRAVPQPIGRAGARLVLVGADGAMGDAVVPSVDAAQAIVTGVDGLRPADWDAETVNATEIGPEHRRGMGRSLTRG